MEGERIIERNGEKLREKIACIKKVEGNPLDPVSGGRLCARGQAAVQGLYHPDRLRGPLRRTGPKGRAEFAPTSWDEALAVAAEYLARVRQTDPTRIVFLTGPQAGSRAVAIARFLEALGASPAVSFEIADFPIDRKAAELAYGFNGLPVYDLGKARYVLSVGADFLGGWHSPVFYSRQYGNFRQGHGRLVHAESRFSLTAANADHWVPLRPGTEPLFTAAIAHLLLVEKLAPQPQLLPPAVLDAFVALNLADAVKTCGVEEKRLRQMARELSQSEAPLVIAGASLPQSNSLDALIAAGWLNVLLGAAGRPGGVLPPPAPLIPDRAAFANVLPLLERAQFVFVDGANPAYTLPAAVGVGEKLAKVQKLVSFGPFLDDTSAFADLLLPDHHALEATTVVSPVVSPVPAATVATSFVQPLYDTRATERVLAELARKLDLEFAPPAPRSLLEKSLPPETTWDDVTRLGGLWREAAPLVPARPKPAALQVAPAEFSGDASEFPLHFQPYFSLQFHDGRAANLPWMQELPDPASSAMWGLPVEIDSQTAAKLGIRTGDRVRVSSPHGQLEAPAYVHPAALPGVVSMAIGQGHRHYGRYASGRGANPLEILAPVWEKVTGALALGATRVRLARVSASGGLIQFSPTDREAGPWGYR
jgi:anaerobic selenocysteine-containing dehydrogenase